MYVVALVLSKSLLPDTIEAWHFNAAHGRLKGSYRGKFKLISRDEAFLQLPSIMNVTLNTQIPQNDYPNTQTKARAE